MVLSFQFSFQLVLCLSPPFVLGNSDPLSQVFIDACKGVVQRCIFLLLGVRTSFPVDAESLYLIDEANKTSSDSYQCDGVASSSNLGPLHIHTDTSGNSTPADTPTNISPRSEVRLVAFVLFLPVMRTLLSKRHLLTQVSAELYEERG